MFFCEIIKGDPLLNPLSLRERVGCAPSYLLRRFVRWVGTAFQGLSGQGCFG